MLHNNGKKVILYNLACTQLLADITGVILMTKIPDQVFHTLCKTFKEQLEGDSSRCINLISLLWKMQESLSYCHNQNVTLTLT